MHDWLAAARAHLGRDASPAVIEEVAQHTEELYLSARAAGESEEDALAAATAEIRAAATLGHADPQPPRLPAAPDPPALPSRALAALIGDLVYGARVLAARPSFTATVVLTLALGIGANTAIFSVVHATLLAPLPFRDPDRLVMMWEQDATDSSATSIVAAPNYEDWRRLSASFASLGIWERLIFNLSGADAPEQVAGMRVSSSLFDVLGVPAALGRTFTPAEDAPGHDVAVISDALWRRQFGADRGVVGRPIRLNGRPFEVIGVMPPAFRFTHSTNGVWVPIAFNEEDADRGSHSFQVAARLGPGVTFAAARAEMDSLGRQLASQYPANRGETATITPMRDLGMVTLRGTLIMLQAAVLLVLLIGCVNVANLVLAQAASRQREFAIRAALGAGPGRLISQLLVEGSLLASTGAVAGVLLAWVATTAFATSLPAALRFVPFRNPVSAPLDSGVLLFTLIAASVTGIVFSLAPAVGLANGAVGSGLKSAGERGSSSALTALRGVLVATELALAVIVLAAAGLLFKTMGRLIAVDPGLDPRGVTVMGVALPQPDFYGPPQRTTFCADLSREVSAVPGVRGVGAISHLPLSGASAGRSFVLEGRPAAAPNEGPNASYSVSCPGYFATLGIPIVEGRDFSHRDGATGAPVAIINEAAAARYWPGEHPVGKRIKLGSIGSTASWMTIVGVAGNVRHFGLDTLPGRELFLPYAQAAWPVMTVTVKASEALAQGPPLRAALSRVDPGQAVSAPRPMQEVIADSLASRRFPMLLLTVFAVVALGLAALGVYGVVSYVVSMRTREIGIRLALGARRAEVVRLVVGRALRPIAGGIALGVAGALATSRLLATLLFDVRPWDPVVLATIVAILGLSGITASVVPARRAASVDPLVVLKEQ